MAWDYAELSKMAKANGGPEKLMDVLINSGKREMFPWLGVAVGDTATITELELAKKELIQGIKNYDAINAKEHSDIIVRKFLGNKKEYMDLLLLADEQEDMINKYLERGEMFVLENDGIKGECVVTKEADNVYEIKNIAVLPDCQRNGYGKSMIDFVFSYNSDCQTMLVGTGDVPSALCFYQKCGFVESHRIKNFFTDNYDHPMFEDGKQLIDMVYLKKVR
jgi:ribosomal protein S18 acetylase RimI-like enzyme